MANTSNTDPIKLFYDGECPLCRTEINHLKKSNQGQVDFIAIGSDRYEQDFSHLDKSALNQKLHCHSDNGGWQTGLDANVAVWRALGKGRWVAWLRWPLVRPIADWCYNVFAKYRQKITLKR